MTKSDIIIDAKGERPGRLASQVAKALRGKTTSDYLPRATIFPKVVVKNVESMIISEHKLKNVFFEKYSGYPSGRKLTRAWDISQIDPRKVLHHAIWGMLPKNRQRSRIIKRLILYRGENA